ncbi:hypothetical protein LAZ67_X004055 [Cordylochernes scorpioides]|uniref:Uncharacterized protein n=1 Tax=Cordylochernes scorpioides TaxID=51811 RepID=A0ABY6LV34_9ARAC|nr:hypothetical protein LAZ67_X004055 [Cordylochernes scorpioides]
MNILTAFQTDIGDAGPSVLAMGKLRDLSYPPYSPELALLDFHLFPYLKEFGSGKRFASIEEVERSVDGYFNSLPDSFPEGNTDIGEMLDQIWKFSRKLKPKNKRGPLSKQKQDTGKYQTDANWVDQVEAVEKESLSDDVDLAFKNKSLLAVITNLQSAFGNMDQEFLTSQLCSFCLPLSFVLGSVQENHLLGIMKRVIFRWFPYVCDFPLRQVREANLLALALVLHHLHNYLPSNATISKLQARQT